MRIVRRGEGRTSPWKNGNGVTHEVAVHPEGADLDGLIWRLSLAEVAVEGPFSTLPGVDRTLAVVEGGGVDLDFGAGTVRLALGGPPLAFPGEAPVAAWLVAGPVVNFNVMTRRDAAQHRLTVAAVPGAVLPPDAKALLCCAGAVTLDGQALHPGDCALLPGGQAARSLGGAGRVIIVCIETMDADPATGEYPGRTREAPQP